MNCCLSGGLFFLTLNLIFFYSLRKNIAIVNSIYVFPIHVFPPVAPEAYNLETPNFPMPRFISRPIRSTNVYEIIELVVLAQRFRHAISLSRLSYSLSYYGRLCKQSGLFVCYKNPRLVEIDPFSTPYPTRTSVGSGKRHTNQPKFGYF